MRVPGQKTSGAIRWIDWTYGCSLSCFGPWAPHCNNAAHNRRAPYAPPLNTEVRCNAPSLCTGAKQAIVVHCGRLNLDSTKFGNWT